MSKKIESDLLQLNPFEAYLKNFIDKYPQYRTMIIGTSQQKKYDYKHLMSLLIEEWNNCFPDEEFFLRNSSYHLNEDFFIPPASHVSTFKNLRYMPLILHSHQFIEVNYVLKSAGSAYIDEQNRIVLQDGDILLSLPDSPHTFDAMNSESIILDFFIRLTTFDVVFLNLFSKDDYLSSLFVNAIYGTSHGHILWHCKSDAVLKKLALSAYEEWHSDKKYKDKMVEVIIMEFFLTLMRQHEQEAVFSVPTINNSNEHFQALLNYMRSHYKSVTLTQLAMRYNYSERQVIRLLKEHSGKTFTALRQEIRMNAAIALLKNTNVPVADLAGRLGYSSPHYFSKVFRETFSLTPKEYRANYQSGTSEKRSDTKI